MNGAATPLCAVGASAWTGQAADAWIFHARVLKGCQTLLLQGPGAVPAAGVGTS